MWRILLRNINFLTSLTLLTFCRGAGKPRIFTLCEAQCEMATQARGGMRMILSRRDKIDRLGKNNFLIKN